MEKTLADLYRQDARKYRRRAEALTTPKDKKRSFNALAILCERTAAYHDAISQMNDPKRHR